MGNPVTDFLLNPREIAVVSPAGWIPIVRAESVVGSGILERATPIRSLKAKKFLQFPVADLGRAGQPIDAVCRNTTAVY